MTDHTVADLSHAPVTHPAASRRPPMVVLHVWVKDRMKKVHRCGFCGQWTANLPLYRHAVCPAADRRLAKRERRQP